MFWQMNVHNHQNFHTFGTSHCSQGTYQNFKERNQKSRDLLSAIWITTLFFITIFFFGRITTKTAIQISPFPIHAGQVTGYNSPPLLILPNSITKDTMSSLQQLIKMSKEYLDMLNG